MRNRTPDCTTPSAQPSSPEPHQDADSWLWFITEKGLRAEGSASMRSTAANLRASATELEKAARRLAQEMPAPTTEENGETPVLDCRRGTVCYRYRNESQVADLRLSGRWLERAGFDRGRKFHVRVHPGRITLRLEPTMASG